MALRPDLTRIEQEEQPRRAEKAPILDDYNLLGHLVTPKPSPRIWVPSVSSFELGPFRRIGTGFCGSVWRYESTQAAFVIKRADGAPTRYLWKEYYYQSRVIEAMNRLLVTPPRSSAPTSGDSSPPSSTPLGLDDTYHGDVAGTALGIASEMLGIHIPHCHWYTNDTDQSWWSDLSAFPPGTMACNAMCSDLIPSLALEIRNRLIDAYCPERMRAEIKNSDKNQDCLARLYLGRRKSGRPSAFFSLRNFPLWLNQQEDLGLPTHTYAKIMARTLAMMHWEAEIDANDVEFLLGSAPPESRKAKMLSSANIAELPYNTVTRGLAATNGRSVEARYDKQTDEGGQAIDSTAVWLLDFDCCGTISMDDEGVDAAASAFYRNDPYFPRPGFAAGTAEEQLWTIFKQTYLSFGQMIVETKGLPGDLPGRFIEKVYEMQKQSKTERAREPVVKCDSPFFRAFVA